MSQPLTGSIGGSDLEGNAQEYSPTCETCRWWEPRFHSRILESHLKKKVIQFLQRRYRIALIFIGLFSLLWVVFFSVQLPVTQPTDSNTQQLSSDWLAIQSVQYSTGYIVGGVILFLLSIIFLFVTYWKYYSKLAQALSVMFTVVLMMASCTLAVALHYDKNIIGISTISFVAQFAITAAVILVVYMLSRLPLWLSIMLCTVYILVLEVVDGTLTGVVQHYGNNSTHYNHQYQVFFISATVSRLFFHCCLNIAGITTTYLTQIRLHDTYWRIGQCVLAKKLIDSEKDIEEKTIHSMMPTIFAKELLDAKVQIPYIISVEVAGQENVPPIIRTITIPFTVRKMNRVSILFADIVGFTRFSSCLKAKELVSILNQVFSKFDELALKAKCETISTLGDCYFCVSGCPKPDANHADNCVEMGLQIIKSLEEYRSNTEHRIRMRVGIHTGSVLCGVMGTQRFRFDVWSRDVTITSRIESACDPDCVMISSTTKFHLSSKYLAEEAVNCKKPPELKNLKLYYVKRSHDKSNIGPSKVAWKQRIRSIDSKTKGGEDNFQVEEQREGLVELVRRRSSIGIFVKEEEVQSSSFRDSLSRQSHLQRCASYADLANPRIEQQRLMDNQIVQLMDEQDVNFDSYFDSRLHFLWASFGNNELEKRYRKYGRDIMDPQKCTVMETELGFKLTKLSYLVDVVSMMFIFILIMMGAAVNLSGLSKDSAFTSSETGLYQSWLVIFIFGLIVETVILVYVIAIYAPKRFPRRFAKHAFVLINWYGRSIVAIFLIYYPMSVVVVSLTQCYGSGFSSLEDLLHVQMAFYITIVVLVSSINFMEVSYIAKMVGGALSTALTVYLIAGVHLHSCAQKLPQNETAYGKVDNRTLPIDTPEEILRNYYNRHVAPEAAILLVLILSVLTVVNRMSEVSVRLSFIGRIEAAARKQFTQQQKNQVEWLLYNIIPPHVALELRNTGRYSCDHECIGVVFASIVNFSDFSSRSEEEESFRFLNRIVREFDSLLNKPQYANVEKIKTIGSTYMAASGLSLPRKSDPETHLLQLIDFALNIGDVLRHINVLVPGFAFTLRVGFNYGPVTSGVVGSRKLMYDIWGDTVNVASRMDTLGQVFKIHMPESCLVLLGSHVKWEANKEIIVKGKGPMKTMFVTGRK